MSSINNLSLKKSYFKTWITAPFSPGALFSGNIKLLFFKRKVFSKKTFEYSSLRSITRPEFGLLLIPFAIKIEFLLLFNEKIILGELFLIKISASIRIKKSYLFLFNNS